MIGTYVYKKSLKECKDFYTKCVTQLQKSVPVLKDEVLRSLTFIHLPERHLASQEELDIILQRFPTVVDEAQLDDLCKHNFQITKPCLMHLSLITLMKMGKKT